MRRPRDERAGGRASRRNQLPARRQPAARRHSGAPDAPGPHSESRHPDLAAQGSGPGRRGIRHRRRHLARASRDRLREIGRLRDGVQQRQPGEQRRALLGGDRPHQEGALPSGRALQLGGQALHAPPREHLAAPLAAAASTDVVGHRRSGDGRRGGPSRHGTRAGPARPRGNEAGVRGASQGARRGRPAQGDHRQLRLRGLRLRRRHRRGRRARRQQAPLVPAHQPQVGAPVLPLPAGQLAAAGRAAALPHGARRPAPRREGPSSPPARTPRGSRRSPRRRRWRRASCSWAIPIPSTGR